MTKGACRKGKKSFTDCAETMVRGDIIFGPTKIGLRAPVTGSQPVTAHHNTGRPGAEQPHGSVWEPQLDEIIHLDGMLRPTETSSSYLANASLSPLPSLSRSEAPPTTSLPITSHGYRIRFWCARWGAPAHEAKGVPHQASTIQPDPQETNRWPSGRPYDEKLTVRKRGGGEATAFHPRACTHVRPHTCHLPWAKGHGYQPHDAVVQK